MLGSDARVSKATVQDVAPLSQFLRMAAVAGVESAVQVHIDRGDDLNARDGKGQTPLMLAAARNKTAVCKLLLSAGADAHLLDAMGRNALCIAQGAGALEAATAIEAVCKQGATWRDADDLPEPAPIASDDHESLVASDPPAISFNNFIATQFTDRPASLSEIETFTAPLDALNSGDGGDEFDLTGWEAEEHQSPPEFDAALSAAASEIQSAITDHQPIDTSADWDDFVAFLPDRATPLSRSDDTEARERLRLILLRAIREGSVPYSAIEDLTLRDDGEPDTEAGVLLSMVINDLGAETDERFEYSTPYETFEVFVASDEDPDEEDEVAAALMFMDDWRGRRNEPLRIYQREFQKVALLTADAEVALGQAMERSIEKALDALAAWPSGAVAILDAAREVESGAKRLRWLSSGTPTQAKEVEPARRIEPDGESDLSVDFSSSESEEDSELGRDSNDSSDELVEFCTKVAAFSGLTAKGEGNAEWNACRSAITSLCLTRDFLMGLAASRPAGECEAARAFVREIDAYRYARDQMTVANLKLVFSIAKKYLFSGEPLDDLLQEGSLGLIKAVDRYDWRRGFKFSTYATWWIRQHVGRYVAEKGKAIRLPVHVYEKIQRIGQTSRTFELRHRRAPTVEELAVLVELPVHKAAAFSRASLGLLPLHELDDVDDLIAADAREQFLVRDPMEIVEDIQLVDSLDRFLGTLKRKEANIVRMRYGIGLQDSLTLEEIGIRLEVTRERVRQIEAKALRRLQHPSRLSLLLSELKGNPFRQSDEEVAVSSDFNVQSRSSEAVGVAPQPKSVTNTSQPTQRPENSTLSALNVVLDYARTVGAIVEISNDDSSQRIWIQIGDTPEKHSGTLARKLTEQGFESWPGGHYFR